MKLLHSQTSPYARLVRVCADELGLTDAIALQTVTVTPTTASAEVAGANPLTKIPTLVLDDGTAIFDSRVICAYLDTLTDRALAPREGPARWTVATDLAQAIGLLDAALLARYEAFLRPEPLRWDDWSAGQMGKIRRALDAFEGSSRSAGPELTVADIGVACALGYLDLRFPDEAWRDGRPRLTAFYAAFAKKPIWAVTDPNA